MKRGRKATIAAIAVVALLVTTLVAAYSVAMASGRSGSARGLCAGCDTEEAPMMRGGGGPGGPGGPALETIAEQLGMSEDELREQLRDGKSIADLASEKGVELQSIIDAVMNEARERLAEEVAEEDLTQKRADEMLAGMEERLTSMLEREGGRMGEGARGIVDQFDLIAELLGITPEELRDQIHDGNSVAELAAEKGVELQSIIDAVLDQARERLAEEVAEENITQKRADEMLEKLQENLPDMLERDMPFGGPGGGGRGMGGPMF